MKRLGISILTIIVITNTQYVFAQVENSSKNIEMELVVTDDQKIILFGCFVIAIIGIFLYLARDIILRRKTTYDTEELDSKKDKTYEKYHSDWSDDYEEFGVRNDSKQARELRNEFQNSSLPDYYKILQLPQNATQDEIKKQYRNLAKKIHPDKTKNKKSEEIMVQLNKAYEILSNENLRKKYDSYLNNN